MKILIIGGSGFIGSHVADQLTLNNHKVTIFDKKESKWIKKNQKFIKGDILDSPKLEKAIKNQDVVYNFAGISDLNEAIQKPEETVNLNILSVVKILESCVKFKLKKFVFASTIYTDSKEGSYYRCSKQAAEIYIKEYNRKYKLKYSILKYGSVYGIRSNESNNIFRIIKKAINKKKLEYIGNLEAIREYINVVDAAKASVEILKKEYDNKSIILTGSYKTKVADILNMIREIMDIKTKINFVNKKYEGHYVRTPYSFIRDDTIKYTPKTHIDLGKGLLELITSINDEIKYKKNNY